MTIKQSGRKTREHRVKLAVITHYGHGTPACVKCGFNNIEALTLDHVNNDGHLSKSERPKSPGYQFYKKLMNDGFPSGLQTMCFSCNMEKEILLRR